MNAINEIWRRIQQVFTPYVQLRAIKDVDEWDGAASRWDSTQAYCDDCLINVNADAGNIEADDWVQSHCMLPIREPGDDADVYVRQAVYAAAGGRGISAVERPDDVAAEDWAEAVESAAEELISAYNQMDEVAPDAIYEAAGQEPPEDEERATNLNQIWQQVDWQAWEIDYWLHNLYVDDDGGLYAIASQEGKLYRAELTLAQGEVTAGEWQRVEVQHVPVTRSINIFRQEDGRYRGVGIACTAILNKDQEIDSTDLFEDFVERFNQQDRASDPVKLDFYHEDIFLGEIDYLAWDGFALVDSWLFRDDEIGRAAAETLMQEPDQWGQSISYKPMAEPELLDVGDGITFPVWLEGKLERVAILPNDSASAWYTTATVQTRSEKNMKAQVLEALKRLVGEEQAALLAGQVDNINDRVTGEGLIARSESAEDPEQSEETEAPEDVDREAGDGEQPEPVEQEEAQVPPEVRVVRDMRTLMQEQAGVLNTLVETLGAFVPEVQERLDALEQSEQERRDAWLADLPEPQVRAIVRPRETHRVEGDEANVDTSTRVREQLAAKGIAQSAG